MATDFLIPYFYVYADRFKKDIQKGKDRVHCLPFFNENLIGYAIKYISLSKLQHVLYKLSFSSEKMKIEILSHSKIG
ncbi:MAG: hypothetical protein MR815_06895 [Oscillospiraceae bacterium]|nr:hypothetical protein [Oscillospiraceae bacterium]